MTEDRIQVVGLRDVVDVEDGDELGVAGAEGGVDVAGLGVAVVFAHHVGHPQALGQCRESLRALGMAAVVGADTAGSARQIAEEGDVTRGALSSKLAAEIYGLEILKENMEDEGHNTTRFIVLAKEAAWAARGLGPVMTSFLFRVRNVPAALYKAMGGFATNGVNMTKLESYQIGGEFFATQFFADIEGHPDDPGVRHAFEEIAFFTREFRILGVYRASPFRAEVAAKRAG